MKKKEPVQVEVIDINQMKMSPFKIALTQSIFRPAKKEGRLKQWMQKKMIEWLQKEEYGRKRFRVIHSIKLGFLHPLLKYLAMKFGKFLVKDLDDIPDTWWNAHHRMFYWSFADKGLKDMWTYMYYVQGYEKFKEKYPTAEDFFKAAIEDDKGYNFSHRHRKLLIDIWMTEIMEDSIDREWLNMSILELTHQMMEFYGVRKSERCKVPKAGFGFPVYLSINANNPQYFMDNMNRKCWRKPK